MSSSSRTASAGRVGLVLAAGFGSRLAGVVRETDLKPLTKVAGTPLIVRTLRGLEQAGCGRAVIVLGYHADEIERGIRAAYDGPLELTFVFNERFELSNGVSVLSARAELSDTFVLTMADHVLGREVMEIAGAHEPEPDGATLLVDYDLASIFDMDDATKARVSEGRITAIGKALETYDVVDTGVFVCSSALLDSLQSVLDEKGDASLSDGVRILAEAGRMQALDIQGGFWQDVDTPEMLAHAESVLSKRDR